MFVDTLELLNLNKLIKRKKKYKWQKYIKSVTKFVIYKTNIKLKLKI